jgi:hypothetical protein
MYIFPPLSGASPAAMARILLVADGPKALCKEARPNVAALPAMRREKSMRAGKIVERRRWLAFT